jgi:ATP-dependent Clp protease ATP-binding subunit ClpC
MFERFTERARNVVVLASDEARALRHNYIGTEHLLLGLLREQEGLAQRVLDRLGVTAERVRKQVVRIVGSGDEVTPGQIPFTPRAKDGLQLAYREALGMGNNYIGTEHLLLALSSQDMGLASQLLTEFGADAKRIRREVVTLSPAPQDRGARPAARPTAPRSAPDSSSEFRLSDDLRLRRLMMAAVARALDDGRTKVELRDLMLALTRYDATAPLLTEQGLDESAMRDALARHKLDQEESG